MSLNYIIYSIFFFYNIKNILYIFLCNFLLIYYCYLNYLGFDDWIFGFRS